MPAEPPAAWTEKAERVIYAHYTCECGCEGADPERAPGVVDCWQCGRQPSVTARNFAYV